MVFCTISQLLRHLKKNRVFLSKKKWSLETEEPLLIRDMSMTMLFRKSFEATYVVNICLIRLVLKRLLVGFLLERKQTFYNPNLLGVLVIFKINEKDSISEFEVRSDEAVFLGYG